MTVLGKILDVSLDALTRRSLVCPLLEKRKHAFRLGKDGCVMVGKSSFGKTKKYEEEKYVDVEPSKGSLSWNICHLLWPLNI